MHRYFKLGLLVLVLEIIIAGWVGFNLPADVKVPIHWNWKDEVDGYAGRNAAVVLFWLFNLALFLLLYFSGRWSPVFKQNQERYEAVIPLLSFGLALFFALFHIYMLYLAGHPEIGARFSGILILMGGLFIFLGNILPRLPRNFIAGIRTPWTFYNDEIWRKTSRLGGWCFFWFGLLLAVSAVFSLRGGSWTYVHLLGLGVAVLLPMFYSLILYLKCKKEE